MRCDGGCGHPVTVISELFWQNHDARPGDPVVPRQTAGVDHQPEKPQTDRRDRKDRGREANRTDCPGYWFP